MMCNIWYMKALTAVLLVLVHVQGALQQELLKQTDDDLFFLEGLQEINPSEYNNILEDSKSLDVPKDAAHSDDDIGEVKLVHPTIISRFDIANSYVTPRTGGSLENEPRAGGSLENDYIQSGEREVTKLTINLSESSQGKSNEDARKDISNGTISKYISNKIDSKDTSYKSDNREATYENNSKETNNQDDIDSGSIEDDGSEERTEEDDDVVEGSAEGDDVDEGSAEGDDVDEGSAEYEGSGKMLFNWEIEVSSGDYGSGEVESSGDYDLGQDELENFIHLLLEEDLEEFPPKKNDLTADLNNQEYENYDEASSIDYYSPANTNLVIHGYKGSPIGDMAKIDFLENEMHQIQNQISQMSARMEQQSNDIGHLQRIILQLQEQINKFIYSQDHIIN